MGGVQTSKQSTQNKRIAQYNKVRDEAFSIFQKKNSDYGDAFADYGAVGVIMRMGDKIRRMANITSTSVTLVEDERLRDTLMDLANYAVMGLMLLDEQENVEAVVENKVIESMEPKSLHKRWVTSSDGKTEYEMNRYNDGSYTCTCPYHKYNETCKHVKKWEKEQIALEKKNCLAKQEEEEAKTIEMYWTVSSWADSSKKYIVKRYRGGSYSCTCKGFEYNGDCKHVEEKRKDAEYM